MLIYSIWEKRREVIENLFDLLFDKVGTSPVPFVNLLSETFGLGEVILKSHQMNIQILPKFPFSIPYWKY